MFIYYTIQWCLLFKNVRGNDIYHQSALLPTTSITHTYVCTYLNQYFYIAKATITTKILKRRIKKSCTYTKRPRTSSIEPTRLHLFPSDVTNGTIFMGYVLKYF